MKKILLIILLVFALSATLFAGSILNRQTIVSDHLEILPPSELKPFCCHQSYFTTQSFYEQAYENAGKLRTMHTPPDSRSSLFEEEGGAAVAGILVNHHLLAGSFIAEAFDKIATDAPLTVLLISPNHFSVGNGSFITSNAIWKTPYGDLNPDSQMIRQLSDDGIATIEENPFEQEHGISGIVAFIKKSLPNARLIPLIANNRATLQQSLEEANRLTELLPRNVLVVGSFDFSHYLTSRAANFHDLKNLSAVGNFDFSAISTLDVDSRPGLVLFLRMMQRSGNQKFHILEQSNSGILTKQDILETTSYITGYFRPGMTATSSVHTLLILGNVVPSPDVVLASEKQSAVLEYVERLLYGQDAAIAFIADPDNEVVTGLKQRDLVLVPKGNFKYLLGQLNIVVLDCSAADPQETIRQGADVVVCPGSKQNELALYQGKPVIFTTGDFLSTKSLKPNARSLGIGLAEKEGKLSVYLLPIGLQNGQLQLLIGQENGKVLEEMAKFSNVPKSLKEEIKTGIIHSIF